MQEDLLATPWPPAALVKFFNEGREKQYNLFFFAYRSASVVG